MPSKFPGISPYFIRNNSSVVPIDPLAQDFFDRVTLAGGTLTPTEQVAINILIIRFRQYNILSLLYAVYPMVGSSANSCAQNLISSSFIGTFSAGWTFASTGALPNGTSAYMDTDLNPLMDLPTDSMGLSYYSGTNTNTGLDQIDIGSILSPDFLYLSTQYNASGLVNRFFSRNSSGSVMCDTENLNAKGFYHISKTSNGVGTFKSYKNGVNQDTQDGAGDNPPVRIFVGAVNLTNNPAFFTNRECRYAGIEAGMDVTQAGNYATAVIEFQTSLGRL